MRIIALINQKGGVGKTTTAVNLGAALAEKGRRVVLIDLDPQANLTLHLGFDLAQKVTTSYDLLMGHSSLAEVIRETTTPGLRAVTTDIHLSGAELELVSALGRETILRDSVEAWRRESLEQTGEEPADYLLLDCPPSLGLLSINALAAAKEVFIAVQTEFFALQGMSKLVEVVDLVRRRMHPELRITGIVPCLYDNRLRLAREVLGELRRYFTEQVFRQSIGTNVKLAEAPSFGQTILEYAPESKGARDYRALAQAVLAQEVAPPAPEEEEIVLDREDGEPDRVELTPQSPIEAEPVTSLPASGTPTDESAQ
jgi:chromosome partitioning protein